MGNRSSAPADETSAEAGSGLFLSPELQAKINADFDSHILQTEWDTYRALHLQRHQQRETASSLRAADVQERTEALRAQAEAVHAQLDGAVDAAKSKLIDLEVEVSHDVDRLGRKFEGGLPASAPEGRCLDVRAELANCYSTLKDGGECEVFARKLDRCVTEALASS